MNNLVSMFKKAGLVLVVAKAPLRGVDNNDIFQIDIQRGLKGNTRAEHFRMWPGKDTMLQVAATDKDLQQLVLRVKEPKRAYTARGFFLNEYTHRSPAWKKEHRILKKYEQYMSRGRNRVPAMLVDIEEFTPSRVRHYLCGVDERQLFIAECPKAVTSIKEAHESLKGDARISLAEDSSRRVTRQGEWFFLETTAEEQRIINNGLEKNQLCLLKKVPLGRGGHPHTADEMVRMTGKVLEHGWGVTPMDTFIRGSVKHQDHKTVRFTNWRKVIRNNEGSTTNTVDFSSKSGGVLWVD